MAANDGRKSAAERDLRLLRLDHFTVPVRDFNVGRKFYTEVLGGVVTQEPEWYWVPDKSRQGGSPGGHTCIQLFNGDGHLVMYWQPWGQPALDQMHPHRSFRVRTPEQLDELMGRLTRANVPSVLTTPTAAPEGEPVAASLYFRDPDLNQLALSCDRYPFRPGIQVGPFNPTAQYYRWSDWQATVAYGGPPAEMQRGRGTSDPRVGYGAVHHPLEIDGLERFTLPVRDPAKAERFYSQVLGAEAVERDAIESGALDLPCVRVRVCPGADVSLVQQSYGWLPPDTFNPHWGFAVAGADVDQWLEHLEDWAVPSALIVRHHDLVDPGVPTRVELHLLDPDGNQIELVAWDYPMSDRVTKFHYNPWALAYPWDSWPPGSA